MRFNCNFPFSSFHFFLISQTKDKWKCINNMYQNKHKIGNYRIHEAGSPFQPRFPTQTISQSSNFRNEKGKQEKSAERKTQKIQNEKMKSREKRMAETWPPTTATEGRASQRDIPSPPWSPRTVQALWILLTSPIKLSIVAIFWMNRQWTFQFLWVYEMN